MHTYISHANLGLAGIKQSMDRIRVLIVDEHLAVRQALAARLRSFSQIDVVAAARTFDEGLERARSLHPDVILLELKGSSILPDPVGDLCRALKDTAVGIIVLTSYAVDEEREKALHAGARRYLLKHIDSTHLLKEIETVASEVAGRQC